MMAAAIANAQSPARVGRSAVYTERGTIGSAAEPFAIVSADFDGDGDIDVATASRSDSRIDWHENATGDAATWTTHPITTARVAPIHLAVADINGDGAPDLVVPSSADDRISWIENQLATGGGWQLRPVYTPPPPPTLPAIITPVFVAIGDVDGDGDLDVVSASFVDNRVAWHENVAGDGSEWRVHSVTTMARDALTVAVGDLNGDGHLDIVAASTNDDSIDVHLNDGAQPPAFTRIRLTPLPPANATESNFPTDVAVADFNGDGRADIAVASLLDGQLAWLENMGGAPPAFQFRSIRFFPPPFGLTTNGLFRIHVADLDADGDPDIVAVSLYDNQVNIVENRLNLGQGWAFRNATNTLPGAVHAAAADLDGDGDLDLAVTGNLGTDHRWLENRGGQFALASADIAPAVVPPGQERAVLAVRLGHRGGIGDEPIRPARLVLDARDAADAPLGTADLSAVIASINLYTDANGNRAIDATSDTLVLTAAVPERGPDGFAIELPPATPGAPPATSADYIVTVRTTAGAAAQRVKALRLVHRHGAAGAVGADSGAALTQEFSADVATRLFAVDNVPPAAPVVEGIRPDLGTPGDGLTAATEISAFGRAEPLARVDVFRNGVLVATTTAAIDGTWESPAVSFIQGRFSLTARATDGAGNTSPLSTVYTVTVDTVAPTVTLGAPSLTETRSGPVTLAVTTEPQAILQLTPERVVLEATGTAAATVEATANSVRLTTITGDGTLRVGLATGAARDAAGNPSPATALSAAIRVDNTPPAIVLSGPDVARTRRGPVVYTLATDDPAATLGSPGVTLQQTGTATARVEVDGATIRLLDLAGDGTLLPVVAAGAAVDALGNASVSTTAGAAVLVDNTAPTAQLALSGSIFRAGGAIPLVYTVNDTDFADAALWVLEPETGWRDSGLRTGGIASGPLEFTPSRTGSRADGTYRFALVPVDDLGNAAPPPGGAAPGQATALYNDRPNSPYAVTIGADDTYAFPMETTRAVLLEVTDLIRPGTVTIARGLGTEPIPAALAPAGLAPEHWIIVNDGLRFQEGILRLRAADETIQRFLTSPPSVYTVRDGVVRRWAVTAFVNQPLGQVVIVVPDLPEFAYLFLGTRDAFTAGNKVVLY